VEYGPGPDRRGTGDGKGFIGFGGGLGGEILVCPTDILARRTAKTEEAWNMVQDLIDAARGTVSG
jgi:hypothetical protein